MRYIFDNYCYKSVTNDRVLYSTKQHDLFLIMITVKSDPVLYFIHFNTFEVKVFHKTVKYT